MQNVFQLWITVKRRSEQSLVHDRELSKYLLTK